MAGSESHDGRDHPSSSALAAYLAGKGDEHERSRVEDHLAGCAECRRDLSVATRAVRAVGQTRGGHRWWWTAGLVAAAAVALLFVLRPPAMSNRAGAAARLRGARGLSTGGGPTLRALSPADGDTLPPGPVRFAWSRPAPGASYHLTITNAEGDVAWEGSTLDTTQVVTSPGDLRPGRRYYWYVDALLAAGGSATTGVHTVTVAP